MSDNPFDNPDKDQHTVYFRPAPGGRFPGDLSGAPPTGRAAQPPGFAPPPPGFTAPSDASAASMPPPVFARAGQSEPIGPLVTGASPLLVVATPLLQLLGRVRNTFNSPQAGELRTRTIQAIRDFETAGRAAGIAHEVLHPARYALCASIDDVVLHTRWGASSTWVQASLVSTFHQEVISGEGFFIQLTALKREPARNLMLLELMFYCLALGYQGQYRLSSHGPAQLELLREDLYQTIVRLRSPYEQGLSPHWRGVEARYRPARAAVPIWVMALVAVAVVAAAWGVLLRQVGAEADQSRERAEAMPPIDMPRLDRPPAPVAVTQPPPADVKPPESLLVMTLRRFLQPEIDEHLVTVWETPGMARVRIFSGGMFASGSAVIRPEFSSILERIGKALNVEPGDVLVTGHTDKVPIHTVRYPSNVQLSLARAEAAKVILSRTVTDPLRMTVEGRADRDRIGNDATEEEHQQNRRIEVTLRRTENNQ